MITFTHYGGTFTTGFIVTENIQTDLIALNDLAVHLNGHDYELVSFNTKGILTKFRKSAIRPPDLKLMLDTLNELKNESVLLNDKLRDISSRIITLETMHLNQKHRNSLKLEVEEQTKEKTTEISDNFYLLWEFLPEQLKKELKIYINKS